MLSKLRDKTSGWIATAILGLLIVPFALVGVTDYFSARVETWVAKVGDVEIGQDQFRSRFDEYRQQMRRTMGQAFDARRFEQPEVKRSVLDRMVDEELLRQANDRFGIVVPPSRLQKEILGINAFQVDGKFNPDQYRLVLSSQNMSPIGFEQRLREDLEAGALPEKVMATGFATTADVDRYLALRDQQRDFSYLVLDPPAADTIPQPTDEQVQTFYDENSARYMTDEQVTIEYVELAADQIDVPEQPDEATLRARYDEEKSRFVEPEQRLASHVLIRVPANADAEAQKAAQQKAEEIAAKARQPGADFAALAKQYSEDPGSKNAGGDLGWLEPGVTDPAFESALFALDKGAISDPVKSAEGWHVIELRDIRPGKERPFEDVRAELAQEYQANERDRLYNERAGKLVDALFRDPTSLQSAADELGLEIRSAGPFGRAGGEQPITAEPPVIEAAFSDQVLEQGNVSDAIELGDDRMVALKVTDHVRSKPIPLADIREQVAREWQAAERSKQARARAEALLAKLDGDATLETLAKDTGAELKSATDVARRGNDGVDQAIVDEAFKLVHPADGAASHGLVALGGDRFALLGVTAVRDGDPAKVAAAERTALAQQLAQVLSDTEMRGLMKALRTEIPVQVAEDRI